MLKLQQFKKEGFLLIIVLYTLLISAFVTFCIYQVDQKEVYMLSNELVGEDSITFVMDTKDQKIDWSTVSLKGAFTLFEGNGQLRGFYFKYETYVPPIVTGRFFTKDDFYSGKRVAVVGKNVSEETLNDLKEDNYNIIGKMGSTYSSNIDNLILLNIDSFINFSSVYTLNIPSEMAPNTDLHFSEFTFPINKITDNESSILNFIGADKFNQLITIAFFIVFIFFNLVITIAYFSKKKTKYNIMWYLGIPIQKPFLQDGLTFFLVATFTYFVISLLSYFYAFERWINRDETNIYLSFLIVGYVLISLVIIGVSITLFSNIRRKVERLR